MPIRKQTLQDAAARGLISDDQVEPLHQFLSAQTARTPRFDFTHVLYYLGGMIAIGAMTLFMNLGWEAFGGWGIFFISLLYAGVGFKLSANFDAKGFFIPAGICATFVVALVPLALYGFQQGMGWWPDETMYRDYHRYIKWHWYFLELGTLAAGALIFYRYRYPFLIMPVAVTLWYLSMDLVPLMHEGHYSYELRGLVSLYFGLLMTLFAFWVDVRSRKDLDYAFWLYIFGVMTFWGGMTSQSSDSEVSKFIYFTINLLMLGIGVALMRRVFVVFGAIGCTLYLGHLANDIFKDSWLFPISLTAIGLGVIYLGVLWQKNEARITQRVRSYLPAVLQELLDSK
jgi:hypothetical protein